MRSVLLMCRILTKQKVYQIHVYFEGEDEEPEPVMMFWLLGFCRTGCGCCHSEGALQLHASRWHYQVKELQAPFCPATTLLVTVTLRFYCSGMSGELRIVSRLPMFSVALWKWDSEETS